LIGKGKIKLNPSPAEVHLINSPERKRTQMSATLRDRHEQLEQRLKTAVLRAEEEINQALAEEQDLALQHYEKAVSRFSRLVVYRQLTGESRVR
jgi:hypothetical protein